MPAIVKNNTLTKITFTIYDQTPNGSPVNLGSTTVNMHYSIGPNGAPRTIYSIPITDAANGKCEYQFRDGDLNVAGLLIADLEIDTVNNSARTFRFSIDILEPVS